MKVMNGARRAMAAVRRAAALGALAWAVAACSGGERINPFKPTRLLAFGDEWSVIESDGRQYSVNALDATTGALACQTHPNWVQYLAAQFGMVFVQCNPAGVAAPQATLYAAAGAKVVDVTAQIDAFLGGGGTFSATDLVTVFVGGNDLLEQFALYSGTYTRTASKDKCGGAEPAALKTELFRRGEALAAQVNRIAALDGRVLILTAPDLGRSPFGLAQEASATGRSLLLSDMACEFNRGLRLTIEQDGRKIGLVQADELMQVLTDISGESAVPQRFGFTNWTDAACTTSLPDCTTATLASGATATTWLWANDRIFGYGGHQQLGIQATTRARNNPF